MAFSSFAEWIAMGGHAPYVWSAWGVTLLLMVALAWHARYERRQLIDGLKRRARREQARQQQNGSQVTVYPVDQGESR
ncbi:heme exporter protein CcmD [Vreelandella aquamarina]